MDLENAQSEAKHTVEIVKKRHPSLNSIELAVQAIIWDVCDRKDIKRGWERIDTETLDFIKQVWKQIIFYSYPQHEDLTIDQLISAKKNLEQIIKMKQDGPKKPIYVVSNEDSNSCFKDRDKALKNLSETFNFHHGKDETEYDEKIRCFVRWIPESDYDKASDSWIEV